LREEESKEDGKQNSKPNDKERDWIDLDNYFDVKLSSPTHQETMQSEAAAASKNKLTRKKIGERVRESFKKAMG